MGKRYIMRIELTGPAQALLAKLSDKHGMTQIATMSRLLEFFSARSERVQAAMMARLPDNMKDDVTKLILKSLEK